LHFRRVSVLDDEHEMTGIDDAIAARANDLHRHARCREFSERVLVVVYHLLGGDDLLGKGCNGRKRDAPMHGIIVPAYLHQILH